MAKTTERKTTQLAAEWAKKKTEKGAKIPGKLHSCGISPWWWSRELNFTMNLLSFG